MADVDNFVWSPFFSNPPLEKNPCVKFGHVWPDDMVTFAQKLEILQFNYTPGVIRRAWPNTYNNTSLS